jgi:carbonic anhydrase/acetyltransferase-like protein (isoleucine patch superfamily)
MILPFEGVWPKIHETTFVAPSADIVGDVVIGEQSSVWFQVVIRGDVNHIRIGKRTNIQDHSVLHVTRVKYPLKVGDEVTVGHRVTLHGCTLGNRILVGMGAIIMDNAVIGDDCIVGAGSLVTQGTTVPNGSLVMGSPARIARPLKPEELEFLKKSAENYVGDSVKYQSYVSGPKKLGDDQQDLETFGNGFENEFDGE